MADDADLTDARLEREMAAMIERVRVKPREAGPYTGYCYWCGENVHAPKRWCDADCRDEWERQQRRGA
ncbi:hypothetical protein [Tepidimonas charontis]|uniref:DUF2116 family Zn-ribbon domain-containing protein n=1 Tax=Tepidimonas charontis TaxID=2267262 RepID=A0A554X2Z6_9BURK|nr:hypothetical protein [Tepidimonas charontis]TSE30212.1 hypothetical protein Tchar_02485 [Tepidimonas charontis]